MIFVCLIVTCILIHLNAEDQQRDSFYNLAFYGHLAFLFADVLACVYIFIERNQNDFETVLPMHSVTEI